jgi:octaprenyl-diphosphate synthase
MGKTLGTDLSGKKPTLPLLHLLKRLKDGHRLKVLNMFQDEREIDTKALLAMMHETGALASARKTAREYVHSALASIETLPPSPALEGLKSIAAFVVARHR